jgi:hypothetical protein
MGEKTVRDTMDALRDVGMLIDVRRPQQEKSRFGNQLFGAKIIAGISSIGVSVDGEPFNRLLGNVQSMAETP